MHHQNTHQYHSPAFAQKGEKEETKRRNWRKESEKRRGRGQPQASMQAQFSHLVTPSTYLGVPKATEVWIKVKQDSLGCPGQGDSPDQQNNQHEVRERGREIHHLGGGQRDKHERAAGPEHTVLASSAAPTPELRQIGSSRGRVRLPHRASCCHLQ